MREEDVAAAARGDGPAFARLVERTLRRAHAVARRIVGPGSEVEDVVQESYTRAYVALTEGRYTETEAGFEAWLARIVVRAAIDVTRSRRRSPVAEPHVIEALASEGDVSERVLMRGVKVALDALAPDQRAALVLRELEGLTLRETAQALGVTEGAVEQRMLRAWAALRRRLVDG